MAHGQHYTKPLLWRLRPINKIIFNVMTKWNREILSRPCSLCSYSEIQSTNAGPDFLQLHRMQVSRFFIFWRACWLLTDSFKALKLKAHGCVHTWARSGSSGGYRFGSREGGHAISIGKKSHREHYVFQSLHWDCMMILVITSLVHCRYDCCLHAERRVGRLRDDCLFVYVHMGKSSKSLRAIAALKEKRASIKSERRSYNNVEVRGCFSRHEIRTDQKALLSRLNKRLKNPGERLYIGRVHNASS